MAQEYERREVYERRRVVEGPALGEDGPVEVEEVRDRGLFGRRHGHKSDYYVEGAGVYGSEPGGRRTGVVVYNGGGYGDRPPVQPEVVYVEGAGYDGSSRFGEEGAYGRRDPDVVYVAPVAEASNSDLGAGLIDSNIRTKPDYHSSLTRPDVVGAAPVGVYGRHGYIVGDAEEERRRKRYAEEAAVAGVGSYGLHERREKKEAEEKLDELGDGRRRHRRHHLFS